MSLANQGCMWHPFPLILPHCPNTHTRTHTNAHIVPQIREWMRMPLLSNALPPCKCQPTHQMPTSPVKRHHSLALYRNLLAAYFLHPRPFSCFLITNPSAQGGCAWVNRAVGACHVCSSGERSSRRWGMSWFVVIDSYLETGLMELSKLYANSLFPYHCRCTLLRCTAHTHAVSQHLVA